MLLHLFPRGEVRADRTGSPGSNTPLGLQLRGLKLSCLPVCAARASAAWIEIRPRVLHSVGKLEMCWIGGHDGFFDTPLRLSCGGHESGNLLRDSADQGNNLPQQSFAKRGEAAGTMKRRAEPGRPSQHEASQRKCNGWCMVKPTPSKAVCYHHKSRSRLPPDIEKARHEITLLLTA